MARRITMVTAGAIAATVSVYVLAQYVFVAMLTQAVTGLAVWAR